MSDATDDQIIDYAMANDQVIITLDADFHTILSLRNACKPSIVRVRIEGLKAPRLAELIRGVAVRF